MLKGVSTREYQGLFDEAGTELGASKSGVSRSMKASAEQALQEFIERPIETRQLAILMDGIHVGCSVILAAVGVDERGRKRVLGLAKGGSENAACAGALLDSLVDRGLDPVAPILFVIDGAKALKKAVESRFGLASIQRCRVHKMRNVLEHLPLAKRRYFKAKLSLAYRLPYAEALAQLKELSRELELLHPGAAASLREGLEETLTLSKMNLPPILVNSLSSTNLIESSFSRARHRMRRVTNFGTGSMALRWCAAALSQADQTFRTPKSHKDLWTLKTALDHPIHQISK